MPIDLRDQKIPKEFIESLPEGLKVVTKRGASYVVVEDIRCPNEHSLLSDMVRIHNEPAITFKVESGETEGTIYLDPFWGLHAKLFDFMFKDPLKNPVIRAFCPVCETSLMIKRKCAHPGCKADQYIEFTLPDGKNAISACAQWGCPEHDMAVTNVPARISKMLRNINYPGLHTHSEAIGF